MMPHYQILSIILTRPGVNKVNTNVKQWTVRLFMCMVSWKDGVIVWEFELYLTPSLLGICESSMCI